MKVLAYSLFIILFLEVASVAQAQSFIAAPSQPPSRQQFQTLPTPETPTTSDTSAPPPATTSSPEPTVVAPATTPLVAPQPTERIETVPRPITPPPPIIVRPKPETKPILETTGPPLPVHHALRVTIRLANNQQFITNRTVKILFDVKIGPLANADNTAPTLSYLLSESQNFIGATWQPLTGPITWTFTGPTTNRTLYAKVRDEQGDESSVVSESLYLAANDVQTIKRSLAVVGASLLAIFAPFNWVTLLDTIDDLHELKKEAKKIEK